MELFFCLDAPQEHYPQIFSVLSAKAWKEAYLLEELKTVADSQGEEMPLVIHYATSTQS